MTSCAFRTLLASTFALLASAATAASAQEEILVPVDPCADNPCRSLNLEERAVFGRLLSKIMGALPSPDPARYEQTGMKSIQGMAASLISDATWQSPTFPTNVIDVMALAYKGGTFPRAMGLVYSYARKGNTGQKFHKTATGELELFDLRLEVTAHATPAFPNRSADTVGPVESGSYAYSWTTPVAEEEEGSDEVRLSTILGARAASVDQTRGIGGEPPAGLAKLLSIRIDIQGPKAEAKALSARVNRKALFALLPPAPKPPKKKVE